MQRGEQGQDNRSERCFHGLQAAARHPSIDPSWHLAPKATRLDSSSSCNSIHDIFVGKPKQTKPKPKRKPKPKPKPELPVECRRRSAGHVSGISISFCTTKSELKYKDTKNETKSDPAQRTSLLHILHYIRVSLPNFEFWFFAKLA